VRSSWFSRYILPGFILKAAVIGGGYLSGRELEQYFGRQGLLGGLLGMGIAMVVWSCVYAATLEFARLHHSYEYRSFFRNLLGQGWVLFEVIYIVMLLTSMAVFTSVAGNIVQSVTGWPLVLCEIGFMTAVAILLFFGTRLVEGFLSGWSFVLYSAFGLLVILAFAKFGHRIVDNLRAASISHPGYIVGQGFKYAGYNVVAMTAVLFCARHIRTRADAILGGLLGGPLAMIPGIFFFVALGAFDPQIRIQTVPVEYLLGRLGLPAFRYAFLAMMAVTLLGTCCALIHALNERISESFLANGRVLPAWARAAIAGVTMIISVFAAAKFGLVALVARGYGIMAWAFIVVFMVPVLVWGIWKMVRPAKRLALG
jgi:uncharacterized membrane protein YkvI